MGGLLQAANVVRPEGSWAKGYGIESIGCALRSETSNVCEPARTDLSGPSAVEVGLCEDIDANIFAVIIDLRSRAMRSSGIEEGVVRGALDFETEKAAGKALWGEIGSHKAETSLIGPSVGTVAAGTTTNATVSAALQEFWTKTTGIAYEDTIVHLGIGRLLEMFGEIEGSLLKNLGIHVATSPGYPSTGIAVTGPITVRLSPDQVLADTDSADNTRYSEANRIAALEFDPCTAVRVA